MRRLRRQELKDIRRHSLFPSWRRLYCASAAGQAQAADAAAGFTQRGQRNSKVKSKWKAIVGFRIAGYRFRRLGRTTIRFRILQVLLVFLLHGAPSVNEIHRAAGFGGNIVTVFIGAVAGLNPSAEITLFFRRCIGEILQNIRFVR